MMLFGTLLFAEEKREKLKTSSALTITPFLLLIFYSGSIGVIK